MIEHVNGDIFAAGTQALVNPVNTDGFMSKGLSAQFKRSYPANFEAYHLACEEGDVVIGRMFVTRTDEETPRYIINFPTKQDRREPSTLEYIEAGLTDLVRVIRENDIHSIAVPGLGSGLGGLHWGDVRPRIEAALSELDDVHVRLYVPLPD